MDDAKFQRFLDLLDEAGSATVGTSVRLPAPLRDAAALAVELGLAGSVTELTTDGLRGVLEAMAQRVVLDEHYAQHPAARPDLAGIARATAAMDGDPLAEHPELIARAAAAVVAMRRNPTPDDVLLYAAGLAAAAAA